DATESCPGKVIHFTALPVNGGLAPGYQWRVNGSDVPGATISTYSFIPTVTGTTVNCVLTSSAACTLGSTLVSNTITLTVLEVCPDITVTGTIASDTCYNATNTITVAGEGTTFTVQNGGHVLMIAGVQIFYLPGTTVEHGGYLHGKIFDGAYCGQKASSIVDVTGGTNELSVISPKSTFRLYPNPTTGNFTLEQTQGTVNETVKVIIYSALGGKVKTLQMTREMKHDFSISEFPVGVYFVRVAAGEDAQTIKLIKTN
ncbi:MAG: T9SS type A sorting domain-containing protein, partial [Bacteroidetes bacterium]|nr:T9SS type A sorting domain-containing protein [Bacteroidota bacterium]